MAGIAAVWLGAVLTTGGLAAVETAAVAGGRAAGVLLVVGAIGCLLANIAPRGTLLGPLLLLAVGLAVVALQRDWLSSRGGWPAVGFLISVGGAFMTTRSTPPTQPPEPVRRVFGVALRRRLSYRAGEAAPAQLRLITIVNRTEIDLSAAGLPEFGDIVELVVTSVFGTVEIDLPPSWPVVAGRVTASRHVRLSGVLDSDVSFDDPDADADPDTGESQQDGLDLIIGKRKQATGSAHGGAAVVIHVLGWGGSITVKGADATQPPESPVSLARRLTLGLAR